MQATTAIGLDTTELDAQVRGEMIGPRDDNYDEARAVHNAMIDRRPALIVRCTDVADVIAVVNFARENDVQLAVRCGGHNVAGFGTVDDGIVLDLSQMKGIKVDPVARVATVQGGCTWGDVDHATHAFGLATAGGVVSTTGVGGLTLGGGLGYLTRRCGLSIDNLLAADVVVADGSFVTASEDQNEDLLWALRGGGGNFGVVTSFTFRLHPIHTVIAGPMLWHIEQAHDAMRMYEQLMADAPDELNGLFAFLMIPPEPPFPEELHLKTMCGIVWCHTGTLEEANQALGPARAFGPPAFELVGPMPHPVLQSLFDELAGPGLQNYWRADFINDLSDESIATHVEHGAKVPSVFSSILLFPIDGVAGRIPSEETAFSYRDARFAEVITGADPDPASADALKTWVIDSWDAVHPHAAAGVYLNFIGDEGQERVQASYRENYARLADIKQKYDPTNLFRNNQNIQPAG
jgi:FAD binding domain-containing protein/berberine-like enzyme